jgi:hypothetical protein
VPENRRQNIGFFAALQRRSACFFDKMMTVRKILLPLP